MQFYIKNYKLFLKFSDFKIYCELKDLKLSRIDGMKGEEVDKGILLNNCEKILHEIFEHIGALKFDKQTIKYYEKSPFQRGLKGIITFIIMSLLQVLNIEIGKISLNLCENLNQKDLNHTDYKRDIQKQKENMQFYDQSLYKTEKNEFYENYFQILKFQKQICLQLKFNNIHFLIDKQENLSIRINCQQANIFLKNDSTLDLQKAFTINNTYFQLDAPFGYSLTYSFVNSTIGLKIQEIVGDYNCNMVPTYRELMQFDFLQARVLRYVRNKILKFQRKEIPYLPKKIDLNIIKTVVSVIDLQEFQDSDGLVGEKVSQISLDLNNLGIQILYNIDNDIIENSIVLDIEECDIAALFQFSEKINLLCLDTGKISLLKHYNLIDSSIIDNSISIKAHECICNIHPVIIPLYNAYINLVLRSYLEYDFDIYSSLIQDYSQQRKLNQQFDMQILTSIVMQGKRDIRQYILTPHEIMKIDVDQFEFYGIIQQNPLKKFSIDSKKFEFSYETFRDKNSKNPENIKGTQFYMFDKILFQFLDESLNKNNNFNNNNKNQECLSISLDTHQQYNLHMRRQNQKIISTENVDLYYNTDSQANLTPPSKQNDTNKDQTFSERKQTHDLGTNQDGNQNFIFQDLQSQNENWQKLGQLDKFGMTSNEQEIISSDFQLDKFVVDLNENQIKCLIQFINKLDMELFHLTKSKIYTNPYTYQNNPYEKQCISNTLYQQFEFAFSFGDQDSNKIKFLIDNYIQHQKGPNVMKMDSQQDLTNIQVEIQYLLEDNIKKVSLGKIEKLSQFFKNKTVNESLYEIDGLKILFTQDVKFLGDFFLVLQAQVQEIQSHAEEIAKKVLKKKKKYIEQKFSEQMVDQIIDINLKNFDFQLEDSDANNFLKSYQGFIREYLSKQHSYNERNCMFNLQKYKANGETPLLQIFIEKIGIQFRPIEELKQFKDIIQFIKSIDEKSQNINFTQDNFKAFRFLGLKTSLNNFFVKIRDYPFKVIDLENITQRGKFVLTTLNNPINNSNVLSSHLQRLFYDIDVQVGYYDLNIGLCLASGINEILNRFLQIFSQSQTSILKKQKNKSRSSSKTGSQLKNPDKGRLTQSVGGKDPKKSIKQNLNSKINNNTHKENILKFFDSWRMNFHGKLIVRRENSSNLNLLTDVYPYSNEALRLTIGKSYMFYESEEYKFSIASIMFKRTSRPQQETHIFKIPRTTATIKFNWACKGDSKDHFFISKDLQDQCRNSILEEFASESLNIRFNVNFPKINVEESQEENNNYLDQQNTNENDINGNSQRKFKKMVKSSPVIFFHYQQEFIDWIQQLPTLRHDILKLYQIKVKDPNFNKNNPIQEDQKNELIREQGYDDEDDTKTQKPFDHLQDENSEFGDNEEQNNEQFDEDDEEDAEEDEQQQSKYTDYVTLFKNSLNNTLNSTDKRGTFLRHIKAFQLFVQMENIRVCVSNHDMQLPSFEENENDVDEEDEELEEGVELTEKQKKQKEQRKQDRKKLKKVIGIQTVFDSLTFSSEFYMRKLTYVTFQDLKNKSYFDKIDDQLEWAMKDGSGKLNFVYAGLFKKNGELLPLNPPIFNQKQEDTQQESIQKFMDFFQITDPVLGEKKRLFDLETQLSKFDTHLHLKNVKLQPQNKLFRFATTFNKLIENVQNNQEIKNENEGKNEEVNGEQPPIRMSKSKSSFKQQSFGRQKCKTNISEELEFNVENVFFKTDTMVYVQNVKQALPNLQFVDKSQEDFNNFNSSTSTGGSSSNQFSSSFAQSFAQPPGKNFTSDHQMYMIKHFLMFGGSQLLITSFLSILVKSIFERKETSAEALEKKMQKIARQKAAALKKQQQKQQEQMQIDSNNKSTTKKVYLKQKSVTKTTSDISQTPQNKDNFNGFGDNFKKKLFLKTPKQTNQDDLKILNVAINVQKPQFNLQYIQKETQIILSSDDECYVIWKTNYLPYDKYNFDPQKQMILFFKSVDAFTIPKQLDAKHKVYWKNSQIFKDLQETEVDKQLFQIIKAQETSFSIISYALEQCELDFSQCFETSQQTSSYNDSSIFGQIGDKKKEPDAKQKDNPIYFWGNIKRSKNLILLADSLNAIMTSSQFKNFQKTLEFLGVLVSSEESEKDFKEQIKKQQNEIKIQKEKRICQHLLNKLPEQKKKSNQLQSSIIYHLKEGNVQMLDSKDQPFLEVQVEQLGSITLYYVNNQLQFDLTIDSIQIYNLLQKENEFRNIIHYNKGDSQSNQRIITVHKKQFNISGITSDTQWTLYDKYDVRLPPITIRLTEDIYDPFYDFFFKQSEQEILEERQSKASQSQIVEDKELSTDLPFYYSDVLIKDLKFCIYYQSESSLKRLNGVSVIIDPFIIKQKFWTTQQLFDEISSYIKRQVASQSFSLLGQKLFGYSVDIEKKEKEKKEKKDKKDKKK